MIPPDNSDGFWSGDFSSDGSRYPDDARHPYSTFGDPTANPYIGPTLDEEVANRYPSDLSGAGTPSSPIDEYGLHFGTHSPIVAPPSPAFLPFGDVVNLSLFANDGPSTQDFPAPTLGPPPAGSTPMQIPTSTLDHTADHIPFGALQMSSSLPYSLRSSPTPMYPDVQRARSGSYAGPTQTPYHHSIHPSAFQTASNFGFGRTFQQVEFQDLANGPERLGSPSNGPTQHVIDFDLDGDGYQHAALPPTILPSSIPLPASPSEESSSSPSRSPTHSPATSTSSLAAIPPSPSTSKGGTFRWRLNSQENPAWRCDCKTNAKKKKRHLESCPRNPNKPKIKCPCCDQFFIGGSRKSALKKHMLNFHKDQVYLLKKYKG